MHSPMLEDPDFDGKPLVMLIGQYSTGKTTFIRYHFFRGYVEHHFSTTLSKIIELTLVAGIC